MTVILWTKTWAEETGKNAKFFKTIESSNKTAKDLKNISSTPLLIIAQRQTHPYGRRGRRWQASDFMATWTWKDEAFPTVFSPLLGLALYRSFQKIWPSDLWSLKAPNDIYLAHKKLAGLLLETQIHKNFMKVILGLGINVLKAPAAVECIKNHHVVNELSWRKFLNHLCLSIENLKNKKTSTIPSNESVLLKQALQKHPQYKDLEKVLKDGSLVFKNTTLHWSEL